MARETKGVRDSQGEKESVTGIFYTGDNQYKKKILITHTFLVNSNN